VPNFITRYRSSVVDGDDDGIESAKSFVVGRKEIDGVDDGVDDHDEVIGSQRVLAIVLLVPAMCVLKYTPVEAKMKHLFG